MCLAKRCLADGHIPSQYHNICLKELEDLSLVIRYPVEIQTHVVPNKAAILAVCTASLMFCVTVYDDVLDFIQTIFFGLIRS
jgi:hypothetical protein